MAGKEIAATGFVLTGDGTAAGLLTVASTTTLRIGQRGFVSSTTEASTEILVTEIISATTFKARALVAPSAVGQPPALVLHGSNCGNSDMSIYDTVDTARVDFPQQFIYNEV